VRDPFRRSFCSTDATHVRPDIVTDLTNVIQENAQKRLSNDNDPTATLVTRRALQVLGAILDEYSSKVLAATTPVMIQVRRLLREEI
jgi:hypothetical protein